jgi:peroxiredoxin
VVVFLIVLAVGISSEGSNNSIAYSVASGHYKLAPDQTTQLPTVPGVDANGSTRTMTLAALRGKVVLVNLFASWCVQCQLEAPVLASAEKLLAAHGGTVLGITYGTTPAAARTFVSRYGIKYPVVEDVAGNFANAYNVSGVPDTFVINKAGKIVALNLYQLTPAWVDQTLSKLLAAT